MRDSVDSYLTAYTHDGFDPVGYPYGQLPEYGTDDIPMAETAYGATFGHLGHRRHHGHRGPGPGWWGPMWGWPYPEVAGAIIAPEPVILDESGGGTFDEEEKKKKGVSGISSFAMRRLHDVAKELPKAERKMFMAELGDPGFVAYIARFLNAVDPAREIMDDALRAIANEFNPRSYPMTRGYWNRLRGMSKKLATDAIEMVGESVKSMTPENRIAFFRKFGESGMSGGGLGFIDTLVATIGSAAAGLYSAKIQASTAKDIAKIQAQAATQQADLAAKMAQAQIAMQQTQMTPGAPGYVPPTPPSTETKILGLPWWGLLVGALAVGGGAYALTR